MSKPREFRELLRQDGIITAPGAYDCITARMIEQAGFTTIYMTGAGTAAALGYPDYGLLTMSEMVANARRIVAAVNLPVIADADTGYGNELNVVRTVREYEQAGVAGIHITEFSEEWAPRSGTKFGRRRSRTEPLVVGRTPSSAPDPWSGFTERAQTDRRGRRLRSWGPPHSGWTYNSNGPNSSDRSAAAAGLIHKRPGPARGR
jgi:hypothetical protein